MDNIELTSLCYVSGDYSYQVMLNRIADVENGMLVPPYKSTRRTTYFENRDRIYRNDGPSQAYEVGVWKWSAVPNRDNPDVDYIQSYYVSQYVPTRMVLVEKATSMESLIDQLKTGIKVKPYYCNTFFCYIPQRGKFTGLLCKKDDLSADEYQVKLQENVHSLPQYSFALSDIYNWPDKNLRFLKALDIGEPERLVSIANADEIIRMLFLERVTWPAYKENIGGTKAEWRNSKQILIHFANRNFIEIVEETLNCSTEQAEQYVADFVSRSNKLLDKGDIDTETLAQVVMNHEGLREQCENAITEKWKVSHQAELATAEAEVENVRKKIAGIEQQSLRELQDIAKKKEQASADREAILAEISEAQTRLNNLIAEIDQYESLGNNVAKSIRTKIADAQQDLASFIAELSVFMPVSNVTRANNEDIRWKYSPADVVTAEETEEIECWQDEFDLLSQNLASAFNVDNELCGLLAAFLYSAHMNRVPLLLAGPYGMEMADALSMSVCGKKAGHLELGSECDGSLTDAVNSYREPVISVQNMFHKNWMDTLPQAFARSNKHILWTHPYSEDLAIEPKGLYNYVLPLFTECFVESIPFSDIWIGKRTEYFKAYQPSAKIRRLSMHSFKKLGVSKLVLNRLEVVLSDAKAVLARDSGEKDLEILFGLLPLSVLAGKPDVLKEAIETEKGISATVKAEVLRYIEEA